MKRYLALFLGLLLPLAANCQEPLVEFFPVTVASKYKGGCGTFGKATIVPRTQDDPVNVTVSAWKSGIVWWFANHTQIPHDDIESWGNYAIRVELRLLDNARNVTLSASWRGVADPAVYSEASSASVDLEANTWGEVTIPAPNISTLDADRINGLVLELTEGQYEVRKISIVPAS